MLALDGVTHTSCCCCCYESNKCRLASVQSNPSTFDGAGGCSPPSIFGTTALLPSTRSRDLSLLSQWLITGTRVWAIIFILGINHLPHLLRMRLLRLLLTACQVVAGRDSRWQIVVDRRHEDSRILLSLQSLRVFMTQYCTAVLVSPMSIRCEPLIAALSCYFTRNELQQFSHAQISKAMHSPEKKANPERCFLMVGKSGTRQSKMQVRKCQIIDYPI